MIEPIAKPTPTRLGAVQAIGEMNLAGLSVFIQQTTLETILDYSESEAEREQGGFLMGGYHVDREPFVEIRHFVPAIATQSSAGSVTFTHDTWAHLHREVERQFPDELVVGWHHTHPNFGIFLSPYDLFVHRHFFREAWQVAMVVDPVRREFGFFQWIGEDIVDCGIFVM